MPRFLLVSLFLALFALPAAAQAPQRIAAVVNDDLISFFDLTNRMNLVAAESKIPRTRENIQRLARDVLRTLIDEKLKLQEAERLNATVSQGEIDGAFLSVATGNNLTTKELELQLLRDGIAPETLLDQLHADLAWRRVQRRLGVQLNISSREIEEELDRLRQLQGKPQWLLGEIFLPVDSNTPEADVLAQINRLRAVALEGRNFPQLAKQFSKSVTAAVSGDLGWVSEGSLPVEVEQVLTKMKPGQISPPIRTVSGYYLMALRAQRDSAVSDPSKVERDLAKFFIPLSDSIDETDRRSQADLLSQVLQASEGCEDFLSFARQTDPNRNGLIKGVILKDLAPILSDPVSRLTRNQGVGPIPIDNGLLALMLCDIRTDTELPSAEEIELKMLDERVNAMGQRRLRELRRAAFIDIRM